MKSLFSSIVLACGTALLIAGNTVPGVLLIVMGFISAVASASLRLHQEQESIKVIKELTEALKKNAASENKTAMMEDAINQLGNALNELFQALGSVNPDAESDPWNSKKGGNNGGGWSH